VAKRACVLGAWVHVGQARDFVFVDVAPCPCGQPLACAVPLVCGGLFELPPLLGTCSFAVSLTAVSTTLGHELVCGGAVFAEPANHISSTISTAPKGFGNRTSSLLRMSRAGEDGDVAGASKKPRVAVAENEQNENEHVVSMMQMVCGA
jgi:hypothetical protein